MATSDAKLLRIRIELEALISERDGMLAENSLRSVNGERLKYGEGNFFSNAEKIRSLMHLSNEG